MSLSQFGKLQRERKERRGLRLAMRIRHRLCSSSIPSLFSSSNSLHLYITIPIFNMSERTPLLSGSVNGPSTASLPSRRDVEAALPSKESRIKVAEAAGALQVGKLPYVLSPLLLNTDPMLIRPVPKTRFPR
jgi:hypothetical protein